MKEKTLMFIISQYIDGTLEIETKHTHYAFDDNFNFDKFQKEELFGIMAEIQEHCEAEGLIPKYVII